MLTQKQIFQLKVILHDISPVVWVRIQIPSVLTVAELFVVVHYSKIVIDNYFFKFKLYENNKLSIKNEGDRNKQQVEIVTSAEKILLEIFFEGDEKFSSFRMLTTGNHEYYQIELEKSLPPEQSINYPVCIGGHILLPSNIEINFSKEFFELEKKTAKEFIEQVFCNSSIKNISKKKSKGFNNPVSESTLQLWNLWFLKVIQGSFDLQHLLKDYKLLLPKEDVVELYNCILQQPLKLRNKAICILSLFKGIPKKYICEYLGVKRGTLEDFIVKYKSGGAALSRCSLRFFSTRK